MATSLACIVEIKNAYKISVETPEGTYTTYEILADMGRKY
jgi:hypothetical protein